MLERLLLFTVFLPFFKLPPSPWPNIEKKKLSVCGGRGVFSQREHHLNWGWGGVGGGVLIFRDDPKKYLCRHGEQLSKILHLKPPLYL